MSTAFTNGTVIVGDGRALEHATVIVDGERITRVTEDGHVRLPKDAERISLDGGTLLPGFIDCHVHLCLDGSPDPWDGSLSESPTIIALKAAEFARRTVMSGITFVRDMGGIHGIDLGLKQAINSEMIPGPRMLVSGSLICMTGGHGWQVGREADGVDAVRKAAREQIKAGADIVKLMATGGVLTSGVEPGSEQLTEAELGAGVEEALKAGKKTAAHAMGTNGILNALRAGIESIEHGAYLSEEAIDIMLKKDVAFVPTISALNNIETKGVEAGIPAFAVDKSLKIKPFHLESLRLARETGVLVGMGTDAGTPFNIHGCNLGEARLLVESGFSPMEAIEAGTGIAARVLGAEKSLGTIEEGKLADLVIVKGNPLDDVNLLAEETAVCLVMVGGKVVKSDFR